MRDILQKLMNKEITLAEAERLLRGSSISEIEELAKLDVNREIRKGFPEIILAEGKQPGDVAEITVRMLERSGRVIISRMTGEDIDQIKAAAPEDAHIEWNPRARMAVLKKPGYKVEQNPGVVGVLTAGTSDIGVAEEVRIIAEEMGCTVYSSYDAGVAGIHRLFPPVKMMVERDVDVLVVIAGREGALPTVVSGLVDIPIIGVPTSIGYGYGGHGVSALMSMLQACSMGIAVVNIDGGVAAGSIAALIARRSHRD